MTDHCRFQRAANSNLFIAVIVGIELLGFAGPGIAQPSARKNANHHGQAAHVAPDITGSLAPRSSGKPQSPTPAVDDAVLPTPYTLPTASRSRFRDCGEKWQRIKLSGEAGEMVWRDFASRCLAAKSGPFDSANP